MSVVTLIHKRTEDKSYFIGRAHNSTTHNTSYSYWSEYLNGKENWPVKPGIAIQYKGGENLVKAFKRNTWAKLVAIEVPADADKRWKKRQHPRR
jgi:hypothetical protein